MKCFNFLFPKPVKLITKQLKIFEAGKSINICEKYRFNSITIKSHHTNDGMVFVGEIDVNVTNGFAVEAGDAISIDVGKDYLCPIYITSNKSGSIVQIFGTGAEI